MDFKIQGTEIRRRAFLSFDVRSVSGEGVPETVFVELISNRKILKTFELQNFKPAWSKVRLPLTETPGLDEVVIRFKPDRIGPDKQGMLEFSNLAFTE